MKTFRLLYSLLAALLLGFAFTQCSKNNPDVAPASTNMKPGANAKLVGGSTYDVIFTGVSQDGFTWNYTVTNTDPSQIANGLSHWMIGLGNCISFEDVVSAQIDGQPYNQISDSEGNTGCENTEGVVFLKFDNLPDNLSTGTHTYSFTLNKIVAVSTNNPVWVKTGGGQVCYQDMIEGPGCITLDNCALSMGYFFAKPMGEAPSGVMWPTSIMLNNISYSQIHGRAIWNMPVGSLTSDQKNIRLAFLQYSAIKLSQALGRLSDPAPSEVQSRLTTIENVFSTYNIKFVYNASTGSVSLTLPKTAAASAAFKQAGEAAGFIGNWISNPQNHCVEQVAQ